MEAEAHILKTLPYQKPFRFVDRITEVDDQHIRGTYRFTGDEFFFPGHFPENPVVPGVIIQEVMAQIGLVGLGIYLLRTEKDTEAIPLFTSANVDFLDRVLPGDTIEVFSKKIYFRFGKLKCQVICYSDRLDKEICRGELAGMIVSRRDE